MNVTSERRRILFVCTANICRSPAAERLARQFVGEQHMVYRSAGFLGSGRGCAEPMIETLASKGIDARDHTSYQINVASIKAADLILTMEGDHLRRLVEVGQESFYKAIPLKEAAAIFSNSASQAHTIEGFLEKLNKARDPRSYFDARWDVEDPYRKNKRAYRKAVTEIEGLVNLVLHRLR